MIKASHSGVIGMVWLMRKQSCVLRLTSSTRRRFSSFSIRGNHMRRIGCFHHRQAHHAKAQFSAYRCGIGLGKKRLHCPKICQCCSCCQNPRHFDMRFFSKASQYLSLFLFGTCLYAYTAGELLQGKDFTAREYKYSSHSCKKLAADCCHRAETGG